MFFEGNFQNDENRYQIAIVVAKFNKSITQRLLDGAIWRLKQAGVTERQIDVFWVPGSFELPTIAEKLCCAHVGGVNLYNAVICLGAVIKGETSHDLHINQSISRHFIDISRTYEIPVMFGVLTCNTVEQANARSVPVEELEKASKNGSPDKTVAAHLGNKGADCAEAALEMIDLLEQIEYRTTVDEEDFDDDDFDDDDFDDDDFDDDDDDDFDDDDDEDDDDFNSRKKKPF